MTQHFSASIAGGWKPWCICMRHILQATLMKISENINWSHIKSSAETNKALEAEENELQAVELEYGGEDIDFNENFDTAKQMEKMQKKQEISNRWQNIVSEILSKTKRLEDSYNQMKTRVEIELQEVQAEEETVDDYMSKTKMTYLDN